MRTVTGFPAAATGAVAGEFEEQPAIPDSAVAAAMASSVDLLRSMGSTSSSSVGMRELSIVRVRARGPPARSGSRGLGARWAPPQQAPLDERDRPFGGECEGRGDQEPGVHAVRVEVALGLGDQGAESLLRAEQLAD